MIKLTNVDKFYNKGKRNELHVIDNTTVSFPNTGFVTLFGESGCGKTTLLNVIGGLDDFKGTIEFDNVKLNDYNMKKFDKLRSEKIGYIFQNYNLLNNLSVIDNLKLALSVNDIEDSIEVDKRIEYALKAVNMFKYRKKLASDLSGGQQQRVAIARALVKKCDLIIADEPTGNLDFSNSVQIMNILKSLSKTKLVILVTHSKELCNNYSDKIIKISDGKIIDILDNQSKNNLRSDNKIYLKDLDKEEINENNIKLNIYSNNKSNVELTLIESNGSYYLKSNVNIIPFTNQVEILDTKSEEIKYEEYNYDDSWFNSETKINIFSRIKNAFSNAYTKSSEKKRKRIFKVLFFLLGFILATINFNMAKASFVETSEILNSGDSVMLTNDLVYSNKGTLKAFKEGYADDLVMYTNKGITLSCSYGSYKTDEYTINVIAKYGKDLTSSKLIYGDNSSVFISKKIADEFLEHSNLSDYNDLLKYLKESSYSPSFNGYDSLYISGIIDENSDCVYEPLSNSIIYSNGNIRKEYGVKNDSVSYISSNTCFTKPYTSLDKSSLVCGRMPENNDEIVISSYFFNSIDNYLENDVYKNYKIIVAGEDVTNKVVGITSDSDTLYGIYTTESVYRYILGSDIPSFVSNNTFNVSDSESYQYYFSLDNCNDLNIFADKNNLHIKSYYSYKYDLAKDISKSESRSYLLRALICTIIMAIYIFFIMRTQIIKDIYQIGVMRSIGMKKIRIYLSYTAQIIVTLFKTVLVSYIISTVVIGAINLKIASYTDSSFNLFLTGSTYYIFFIMLLFSIIIGLIPVYNLIRKTPAKILAKYDI